MTNRFGATRFEVVHAPAQKVSAAVVESHQERVYAEMFRAIELLGRKLERSEEERELLARRLALIESAATLDEKTGKFYLPVAVDDPSLQKAVSVSPSSKWAAVMALLSCAVALFSLSVVLLQSGPALTPKQVAVLDALSSSSHFAGLQTAKNWHALPNEDVIAENDTGSEEATTAPQTKVALPAVPTASAVASTIKVQPQENPAPEKVASAAPMLAEQESAKASLPESAAPKTAVSSKTSLQETASSAPLSTPAPAVQESLGQTPLAKTPETPAAVATVQKPSSTAQSTADTKQSVAQIAAPQSVAKPPVEKSAVATNDNTSGVIQISPDETLPPSLAGLEKRAFSGVAEAQHDLATVYAAGKVVPQNYKRAVYWFSRAADGGIANADYNLGVMFQQGLGVGKNLEKAIGWYTAAAALGHPEAMYNLGIAYVQGIGVKRDIDKGAGYFRLAANAGVAQAAYNLGVLYESNFLGPINISKAIRWYQVARNDGHADAQKAIDRLTKQASGLKASEAAAVAPAAGGE